MYAGSHYLFRLNNLDRAQITFAKACKSGTLLGCHNLAVVYQKQAQEKLANKTFKQTCEKGLKNSCLELAYEAKDRFFKSKKKKDYKEAVGVFSRYCIYEKDEESCKQRDLVECQNNPGLYYCVKK